MSRYTSFLTLSASGLAFENKNKLNYENILSFFTVIPCTVQGITDYIPVQVVLGCDALKSKLLENRCTLKHAFSYIFIRVQIGYTVQYIDILKSYLNLNKYMSKKLVLWCIYFQVLGF